MMWTFGEDEEDLWPCRESNWDSSVAHPIA